MPKRVDHAQRRAHIIDALVRVAAAEGLHTVTLRTVAGEAGMSLNLVQYYFETKGQLLHAALKRLEQQSHTRWTARLDGLPQPVSARAFIDAFLAEALPTDADSRAFHLVWTSYAVLAMTDPELAAQPFIAGPDRLEQQLADALKSAQQEGALDRRRDTATEAALLLSLSHGLGTSVLVGQRSANAAVEILRAHLDRLFAHPAPDRPEPAAGQDG
ncbi:MULTISPECIES: TetR/AcrR family transcriptional regulator [unclassified Streptomyces]|uniref:TetR/AcrR family transcriptional regulator n=1 Tax=unclassified Streptomyces TaxID=2593676 RepID=UPI002DDBC8D1|nr:MULTISPECIES: TetR/AcrR family transcriptional regulator [unclassified Streptomyces]WSA96712.1 TetR/AcrR family transcriptional regulator [Streptomyces sp. NBC_01795]WSB81127.1 TetR/AcrR family transcriptional regulator [Streptomyces sp. NBC_01775]WSS10664.1 TetR/AcrR family transcriptional regulator [Streptomyces sp. NBC_01186]WSS39358.1 TetR/AcrR family transcriptional regulator [Streptomyces sp. NBC_01187]